MPMFKVKFEDFNVWEEVEAVAKDTAIHAMRQGEIKIKSVEEI